ncbi:DUF4286 family protein [Tahibacter amnicola]|uniref:DUF4286 family protein n=1 Tax=Tahibacter amnicola TaxID=2976241 RepID=A0ABY6BGG5_9GAMM|nr:DUF4286 family protein [Tahibacter amnicola]UXI69123.1 DUF4286 family protein [Tahibacter amnicola]
MIIYEVAVEVDRAIEKNYREWLRGHVEEIIALPGFLHATVHDRCDVLENTDRVGVVMHYTLTDQSALDSYLAAHAPRLREDALNRFGGRFSATRRVMQPMLTLHAAAVRAEGAQA